MRGGRQQVDIVALALGIGGELLDQLRQQGHDLVHHSLHRLAGGDAAIEHAVEQVLYRPGQFADHQGTDHPSATLEGMEGTAYLGQRFAVVVVGFPGRQVAADGLQDLAGLLDEDLAQFLVHRFLVGRRWQQADRNVLRRRVDRLHRRSHHLGQRQGRRFAGERLGGRRRLGLSLGQLHLGEIEVGKIQFLQPRALPGGHLALRLRQGYIQRQRIERIENQLLFSGAVERLQRRQRLEAFQRRVEGQRRLLQAQIQRLAGLRRLRQVIAEPPLLRQRPVRQGRRPGGRGRIGGQVEAGEIDLVEAEIVQAAGRRRGRLRLAALLDHLRQRRRHFGGIVQRQVQGQVEGRLAGVGRDFAKGPVVVAGQLRGIFPRGLGRSRVGGRLLRCLGDLDDRLRPLRLGSRGLDGSGPGQARLGRGRRIRFQRIAEVRQAVLGDVEDQVALAGMVLAQALQVILDAGDGIGQGIQALPVRHRLARQQLFLDIAVAGFQQGRGALQRDHRQAAADLGQQLRHAGQVLVVPLRGDELDDRVLGLLQTVARFLDHQLVDLRHIGGGQAAFLAVALVAGTGHAGQGGLDVEQRAGDVHQDRVARLAAALGQGVDDVQLVEDDLARLAEAEYRQGIGDLLERRQEGVQFRGVATVAAHEQVEAVLDPHQFLAQGTDHRTHRVAVGSGEAGALGVHRLVVGQRLVEAVLFLQSADPRRLRRRLGHVEQQVLHQLVRRGLVQAVGALLDQALEFAVELAQQGAHRGAVDHATVGQALDQAGSDAPQRPQRCLAAQALQARIDTRQVAEAGGHVLVAQQADQGHLLGLAQLAQQAAEFVGAQLRDGLAVQLRLALRQVGREQAGFREQLLAARGAQVVEQRQDHHRQVAPGGLDPVEVDRQLQDRLHQHFQGLALVRHATVQQGLDQLLHFLGEQGRAVELDHLQGALHLVHVGQAEPHAGRVLRVLDERFQRLARLFQGFGDLAFHPLQSDVVVPVTHSHSIHVPEYPLRVKARTRSSATGSSSGWLQSTTSPTPITSKPPGASRSANRLRISRRRQRRK